MDCPQTHALNPFGHMILHLISGRAGEPSSMDHNHDQQRIN